MTEAEERAPEAIWTPLVMDWAFKLLPQYLDGAQQAQIRGLELRWQELRFQEIGEYDRVAALIALQRRTWPSELAPRVQALQDELAQDLSLAQASNLGLIALESGHLRLAEQEDIEGDERVEALLSERDHVLATHTALKRVIEEGQPGVHSADELEKAKKIERRLRSLANKLLNHSDEARLALRLEKIFGARQVSLFSRFTFLCLIGLLFLMIVDAFVPRESAFKEWLLWMDTGICFVFLWEFAVRVALASRRHAWVLRHLLTDFVPAIPFGLLISGAPVVAGAQGVPAGWTGWITSIRLVRIPLYARYVRILKPLITLFRLLVFWVRGMDRIVSGMAPLLNREIMLFEREEEHETQPDKRRPGREHRTTHAFERLSPDLRKKAAPGKLNRLAEQLGRYEFLKEKGEFAFHGVGEQHDADHAKRKISAEELLERLEDLRAEDVEEHMQPEIVSSLGRLLALMDLPLIRSLPFLGAMVRAGKGATASDRVAQAGRKLGAYLGKALALVAAWADLSGVLTPPQILDRIATALQKSTQRPAVRLLLLGFIFLLIEVLIEKVFGIKMPEFLKSLVGIPLLALGTICLILLILARWLKRVAGGASERLLRGAEARYVNLLELHRRKREDEDRAAMLLRVLGKSSQALDDLDREVEAAMDELRQRKGEEGKGMASTRARRLALLLLDAQDAAFLHRTDTKGAEQFLSHPDLWNLRHEHLGISSRDVRKLGRLDLEAGGIFSGPFLWFDLMTHAVALKVSRLCSTYNLHLVAKSKWKGASEDAKKKHMDLLRERCDVEAEPAKDRPFRGSFFHVLHFLDSDEIWTREIESEFGPEVCEKLIKDREHLVRELFGTRALHLMPRDKRCFNPYDFYQSKIGGGRIVLLPFKIFVACLKLSWILIRLAAKSARDILDPRIKTTDHVDSQAPFSVARRKLERMKKPLLFEIMRLLARVDPEYLGLGPQGEELEQNGTWLEDLDRIDLLPSEQEELERIRARVSCRLLYLPEFLQSLSTGQELSAEEQARITSAFAMDERGLARLSAAEQRASAWLYALNRGEDEPPGPLARDGIAMRRTEVNRGFRILLESLGTLSRRERRNLRRALRHNLGDLRLVSMAFAQAAPKRPGEAAKLIAASLLQSTEVFRSRIESLRAISGLVVQDLIHHEELIHSLGGYGKRDADGSVKSEVPDQEALDQEGRTRTA